MPWGSPFDDGRTALFVTLAGSNFDFFGDLLYLVVNFTYGGYQHIGLVIASITAFVAPAIACALRNDFFRKFVATGRTISLELYQKINPGRFRSHWCWASFPKFLQWLLAWLLLLGLVPLLLLLWTFVLLGTLVLGVNMKLFALPRFLRFYHRLLNDPKEDQVVALNYALFFELTLESVPQICVVIINEWLTPSPWSPLAIVTLSGSIFFATCLLWKFGYRICMKGPREGLRVPVLACNQDQADAIKKFTTSRPETVLKKHEQPAVSEKNSRDASRTCMSVEAQKV